MEIICPYYRKMSVYTITCDGLVEDSEIILSFRNRKDRALQSEVFCCKYVERCEIYRMLRDMEEE
jgi:hypothetical protein